MAWLLALVLLAAPAVALAHGVTGSDQQFLEQAAGSQIVPFMYLGAKHMVTGYDHLLFLVGVIFFLYRLRDVAIYVTLFSIGHSVTLLYGVLSGAHVDPYLVDAVIGFSVVYKGLDNLDLLKRWLGFQPSTKGAVLLFGLFHGFGLATKLQDFSLSQEGLVGNILAFNVGVELGQFLALGLVLIGMGYWRRSASFARHASHANVVLIIAGFGLVVYQLHGFFTS
jgi:hypothetical protein